MQNAWAKMALGRHEALLQWHLTQTHFFTLYNVYIFPNVIWRSCGNWSITFRFRVVKETALRRTELSVGAFQRRQHVFISMAEHIIVVYRTGMSVHSAQCFHQGFHLHEQLTLRLIDCRRMHLLMRFSLPQWVFCVSVSFFLGHFFKGESSCCHCWLFDLRPLSEFLFPSKRFLLERCSPYRSRSRMFSQRKHLAGNLSATGLRY